MYNMPRIWLDYAEFAGRDCFKVSLTLSIFDRALQHLPVTQHKLIWEHYINFVLEVSSDQYEESDEYYIRNQDLIEE